MNLEDLKEKLKEQWTQISDKIQESNLYNTLLEKFQSLSSTMQKLVILLVALLVILFFVSIPLGYLSSSEEHETSYDDNLKTLRNLLKVDSQKVSPSELPAEMLSSRLRSKIEAAIRNNELLDEQIGSIQVLDKKELSKQIIPKGIEFHGFTVNLDKLNLKQVVDIGKNFSGLNRKSIKLADMTIKATQDNYFRATYKIVNYFIKAPKNEPKKDTKKKKSKKRKRGSQ